MFESARIKLTGWYLLIIMTVSLLFSLLIYTGVNQEFIRIEKIQERIRLRQEYFSIMRPTITPQFEPIDPNMISTARMRVIGVLGVINVFILSIAGAAGYFLAGRTLKPIKKMVEEQNRFIADASHELRTPITSLRSEIEVNLRNKKLSGEDAKKLLESNLEEVISLQSLSDNLLELAQPKNGNVSSSYQTVILKNSQDEAVKRLQKSIKQKRIAIHSTLSHEEISGNPEKITELFVILFDNSVKYSPSNSTITVSADTSDGFVKLHIADTGYGISEEDIHRIFERFYRGSKSRSKTNIPGYGLGLSIAKNIVEIHHGTISVESQEDKGTQFTIQFPKKK